MNGVLLINKQPGMTSFDVVRMCRTIFHEKKIGHTGTLDPNAEGLLIVLLGKYTKLLPYCVKDNKHYIATMELGKQSTTQDIWGEIVRQKEPRIHTQEELNETANTFLGDGFQVPPMYSAIKIDGKKLYELARKNVEIERKPRPIHIAKLDVFAKNNVEYQLDAIVSSGTYIRTLIEDYANALEEYALMTSLKRVGIEHLSLADAYTLEQVQNGQAQFLDPICVLSPEYEVVSVEHPEPIFHGKAFAMENHSDKVVFTYQDEPLAVYEKRDDNIYHCVRGLY